MLKILLRDKFMMNKAARPWPVIEEVLNKGKNAANRRNDVFARKNNGSKPPKNASKAKHEASIRHVDVTILNEASHQHISARVAAF